MMKPEQFHWVFQPTPPTTDAEMLAIALLVVLSIVTAVAIVPRFFR